MAAVEITEGTSTNVPYFGARKWKVNTATHTLHLPPKTSIGTCFMIELTAIVTNCSVDHTPVGGSTEVIAANFSGPRFFDLQLFESGWSLSAREGETIVSIDGTTVTAIANEVNLVDARTDILVSEKGAVDLIMNERSFVGNPIGFVNRTDSVIDTFDDGGVIKFRIAPHTTLYVYFSRDGGLIKKFIENTTKSIALEQGNNYLYFDGSALKVTPSFNAALVLDYALIAQVYMTGTSIIFLCDERHGTSMSPATHYNLHLSRGSILTSGGTPDLTLYTSGTVTNLHAQVEMTAGVILDEDITLELAAKGLTTSMQVLYHIDGIWHIHDQVGPFVSLLGIPQINISSGLTPVTSGRRFSGHIIATNSVNSSGQAKYYGLCGQVEYSTLNNARAGIATEINSIYAAGLPLNEFVIIASVLYVYSGSNFYGCYIVSATAGGAKFLDWRNQKLNATGSSPSNHSSLTGLSNDDHLQYARVGGRDDETITQYGVTVTGSLITRDGTTDKCTISSASTKTTINAADELALTSTNSNINVAGTTASSSTTTGALIVGGGVGIAGDLHAQATHSTLTIRDDTSGSGALTLGDAQNQRITGQMTARSINLPASRENIGRTVRVQTAASNSAIMTVGTTPMYGEICMDYYSDGSNFRPMYGIPQIITGAVTNNTSIGTSSTTFTSNLALQRGVWLLFYSVSYSSDTSNYVASSWDIRVKIDSGTPLEDSVNRLYERSNSSTLIEFTRTTSFNYRLTVTAESSNITLVGIRASSTSSVVTNNSTTATSKWYAMRIT